MKKNIEERKLEIYEQIEKIVNLDKKGYNRILSLDEKAMLNPESFGYLLSLYHYGSIDHIKLEKLIFGCFYIALRREEPLSLSITKSLVNMLLFYDNGFLFSRELLPYLISLDKSEDAPFETIN